MSACLVPCRLLRDPRKVLSSSPTTREPSCSLRHLGAPLFSCQSLANSTPPSSDNETEFWKGASWILRGAARTRMQVLRAGRLMWRQRAREARRPVHQKMRSSQRREERWLETLDKCQILQRRGLLHPTEHEQQRRCEGTLSSAPISPIRQG